MPEVAGRLRKRVTIEAPTENQNAAGEPIATWNTEATVWADVEPLVGRELFGSQQRFADVTHKVTLRYRTGLTPKKRLKLNGRIFNILAVLNLDEQNYLLQVLAKELV